VIVIALLVLWFLLIVAWASYSGAPWVPARRRDFQALLDDAHIQKNNRLIELGCGDGRLLVAAANRGAVVVGYEINPLLWLVAWLRCINKPQISVRFGNFWQINLQPYDVVITFLVPRTMPRLDRKAKREMKPGSRLISYIFEIKGKKSLKKGQAWFVYKY
jgi:ribosomal protein L11 methylase PrmA